MFRNLCLWTALFVEAILPAQAQEMKRVQLPVTAVTVFANGAQVNRTGKVALPAGKSQVFVGGITGNLLDGTLQVTAGGKVVILSIIREEDKTDGVYAAELQKLSGLLQRLKDSLEMNRIQLEVLQNEKEVLLLNRKIEGSEGVKTAELKQLTDFMVSRLTEISRQAWHYQKEMSVLEKRIQEGEKKLEEIRDRQLRVSTGVKVLIESPSAVTTDLALSYMVAGAGWYPLYDIRLPEEGKEAKLVSRAKVWQYTGVDWNNVSLVLSSGNPQAVRQVPVIYPYYLHNEPRQVMVKNVINASLSLGSAASVVGNGDSKELEEELEMDAGVHPIVNQAQSMNNVDYIIKVPYTILSGGDGSEVQIAGLDIPVTYEYIVIPRVSQDALLVAGIAGFSTYNLPEGEVSLYLGNSYRGTQLIDRNVLSPVTDVLSLSMGVDKGITVKRMPEQNFRKVSGGTVRVQKSWETTIRNNKNVAVRVKVEDQYPLSQEDKIKVEDLTYTQENAEVNALTGKLTWTVTLQPKESVQLHVGYTVRFPKDWDVPVR